MNITGDFRKGSEFQITAKPHCKSASTFVAWVPDGLFVTSHMDALFNLPDDTVVVAHWHGEWRTDGFGTTVKELKIKANLFNQDKK